MPSAGNATRPARRPLSDGPTRKIVTGTPQWWTGLHGTSNNGSGLIKIAPCWSLTSLQHRLMKTGGRLVKHARYYWLLLAEGHLNRRLFGDMLHRIWALPLPSG